MKQCPKCGRYMTPYIQYTWDGGRLFWNCNCGYMSKLETYITSDRTDYKQENDD